jgi:hypothetical protein
LSLGAVEIARTLGAAGVDALAVDTVAEDLELRGAGVDTSISVMDIDVVANAADCVSADLMPTVARVDQASRYAELGRHRDKPVIAWQRTDIGFHRFGPRDDGHCLTSNQPPPSTGPPFQLDVLRIVARGVVERDDASHGHSRQAIPDPDPMGNGQLPPGKLPPPPPEPGRHGKPDPPDKDDKE